MWAPRSGICWGTRETGQESPTSARPPTGWTAPPMWRRPPTFYVTGCIVVITRYIADSPWPDGSPARHAASPCICHSAGLGNKRKERLQHPWHHLQSSLRDGEKKPTRPMSQTRPVGLHASLPYTFQA